MSIDIRIEIERKAPDLTPVCFTHAVQRAMKGEIIREEIVQVYPEYGGPEPCQDCCQIEQMFSVDLDNIANGELTPPPTQEMIDRAKEELERRNK